MIWQVRARAAFSARAPSREPGADLDAATYQYRMESVMQHGVVLTYPFKIAVPFEELTE